MQSKQFKDFCNSNNIMFREISVGPFKGVPGKNVTADYALFNGIGLGIFKSENDDWWFSKITYPRLETIKEPTKKYIQRNCGYSNGEEIGLPEAAVFLGEITWTRNIEAFSRDLLVALRNNQKAPAHLYLFRNENEWLCSGLNGTIYPVCNSNGEFLCHLYQTELYQYQDRGIISPAYITNDGDHFVLDKNGEACVYKRRIEIINFDND